MDTALKNELDKFGSPVGVMEEKRLLRALFYGDPGAGKTTLAGHLVENKGAIFTTDSAYTVLQKYPDIADKVTRWPFQGFSQIKAFVQAHSEGIEPYAEYDTLIWDTVSTSIDIMLRRLVDARKYPKEQHDPEVEGWPHYRLAERALRDTVEYLTRSNLNIIYTAHIKEPNQQDKEKKRFAIRPNAPEASFKVIAQEVQLLGWLYKEARGNERLLQLEGTLQETAKSQIPTIEEKTYKVSEIPKLIQQWKQNQN